MTHKILVIDDEEKMCWALERALSQEGYQVVTATRGLQGIELGQENRTLSGNTGFEDARHRRYRGFKTN